VSVRYKGAGSRSSESSPESLPSGGSGIAAGYERTPYGRDFLMYVRRSFPAAVAIA
jgi:hypothetical protein